MNIDFIKSVKQTNKVIEKLKLKNVIGIDEVNKIKMFFVK